MTDSFDPRAFIARAPWRFARTMRHLPDEYVGRGDVPEADFQAFLAYIEQSGFNARWRHLRNAYLELDGWRYWAMRTSAR